MSNISMYWYKRQAIPNDIKQKIKNMVIGEDIDLLNLGDEKKKLLMVDGITFRKVFVINRKYLFKGEYTAPSDENNYCESKNYLTEDGLAGFSVTKDGWLVSLFSNYTNRGFAKAIKKYVIKDAYKLVCIVANTDEDNSLVELYKSEYGFRKYAKTINDIDVMREHYGNEFIESFVSNNGIPFHIFMIGNDSVGESSTIKEFEDYFEAEKYVNTSVKRIIK